MLDDLSKDRVEIGIAVASEQRLRGRCVVGFTQEENDLRGLAWLQCNRCLQSAARIEAGTGSPGQGYP